MKHLLIILWACFCSLMVYSQCPPTGVTCDQTNPGTNINTNFAGEVICITTSPGSNINSNINHDDVKVYVCTGGVVFNGFSPRSGFEMHALNPSGVVGIGTVNFNNPNTYFYAEGGGELRMFGANMNSGPTNFYSGNESQLRLLFSINTANQVNVDIDTNSTGYINGNVTISNGDFNIRQGASLGVNGDFHGNGTNVRVINYDSVYVANEFYVQGTNAFQNACGESILEVGGDFRLNSSSSLINEGTIRSNSLRINSSAGPISMGEGSNFIAGSIDAMNTKDAFEFTGGGGECALVDFTTINNWNFDLTADVKIHYCGPATGSKPGSATISCVCTSTPVYCDATLPVTFVYVKAVEGISGNRVLWATSSEENNSHFIVQRSLDGRVYEDVGVVQGSGTVTELTSYEFTDATSPMNENVYYRIKQVDYDGEYLFSTVVDVRTDRGEFVQIFENPITAGEDIKLLFGKAGEYNVKMVDIVGRLYVDDYFDLVEGELISIKTDSDLFTGVFHLIISSGDESKVIKVLVK